MLRRLLTLLVLVAIVSVAVYMWKVRPGSTPILGAAAREFGREARDLGAEARDKLEAAGEEFQDAKVTAYVKTALGLNRSLRPYSIEVSTENGVVTLRGRLEGEALRTRAESVAAEVPGVTRVVNQLDAAQGAAPLPTGRSLGESVDDDALETQVKLALSLNKELRGSDLTVQVYRREVTLGGEVASPTQRQLALQNARDTASVTSVVDHIQVRGMLDAGRASAVEPAGASNTERAAAAQRALQSNPNLEGFDLRVREEGGRLVLHGQVRTPAEKDLAGLLAREAAGGPVENGVEVRAGAV